jgi:predicted Zn-dependent protease
MQLGHVEAASALIAESRQAPPFQPLPDPWMERLRTFDVSGALASQQADRQRERGLLDEAARTLSTLSRRFPERSRPRLNLALTLRERGLIPEAVSELEKLSRQFPDDPLIRFHLAITLAQAGNKDAALQQLNDCLKIKPDYGMARAALGDLLDSREQVEDAIAAYQQAVSDSPADPWIRLGFIELLLARGRKVEATRQLNAAKNVVSDSKSVEMGELLRLESLVIQMKSETPSPAGPRAQ